MFSLRALALEIISMLFARTPLAVQRQLSAYSCEPSSEAKKCAVFANLDIYEEAFKQTDAGLWSWQTGKNYLAGYLKGKFLARAQAKIIIKDRFIWDFRVSKHGATWMLYEIYPYSWNVVDSLRLLSRKFS